MTLFNEGLRQQAEHKHLAEKRRTEWNGIIMLIRVACIGIGIGFFPLSSHAQMVSMSELSVEIHGLQNQQGQICLSLFSTSQGFPSRANNAIQSQCVNITNGSQLISFQNLQPGSYAVAALHDANGDRTVNRNFLGMPEEGFGFSRNPTIQAGAPSFSDAVILVAGPRTDIQIQLQYF